MRDIARADPEEDTLHAPTHNEMCAPLRVSLHLACAIYSSPCTMGTKRTGKSRSVTTRSPFLRKITRR